MLLRILQVVDGISITITRCIDVYLIKNDSYCYRAYTERIDNPIKRKFIALKNEALVLLLV